MSQAEKKVINTKEDLLVGYVNDRREEAETYWKPIQDDWRTIKKSYTNTRKTEKSTDANISVPYLKKIIRNKVSHFMDMLLSKGAESFDLEPGEETDEKNAELLQGKIVYDLNNAECERKLMPWIQNYEAYGYGVACVPWRYVKEKQRTGEESYKDVVTFDGPDIENVDILTFRSDPWNTDLSSWKIFTREHVPATYLRQKEKEGLYTNIAELKDTSYPENLEKSNMNAPKDSVELLEFHGLVPQKLIEGKLNDNADISPFTDDYVWSIITVANRKRVIRAAKYPYWCGNIFVPIWKDKLTGENKGIGTGEDLSAIVPMVTNLYNKLTDIVNQIANNMYEFVAKDYLGNPATVKVRAGKFFPVKKTGTITALNTTGQAAALGPLYQIITMFEKIIEELTSTPPQVMPSGERDDVHSTYSGLMQMTQQAMLPIQTEVKNNLEPAFKRILEIFYKHNIQFFKKANAVRVLGEKRAKELNLTEITRENIILKGNPDFIPTGVSGFIEKMTELKMLMTFFELGLKAYTPVKDPVSGQQVPGQDGKPQMEPVLDIREVIKRIADRSNFKDIDKLIPSLAEDQEKKESANRLKERAANTPNKPGVPALGGSPGGGMLSPLSPQGGQGQNAEAGGVV